MSSTNIEHGGQHDHQEIHLPDPSVWPLVAGVAAMLFGFALIWWSRDRSDAIAGPALGGTLILLLFAVIGWAWQDTQMRRKAAEGEQAARTGDPRYTQVLTFAIPDGQLDAARGENGILTIIDRTDLRDLSGFQDLRITVSPADVGPSQVLVETTWSGREELESYNATRQSLLDILSAHPEQVVPGSVQAFDMEVVRDTKETAFRFSIGAAAALFGAFIVGGVTLGAALSAFESDHAPAAADNGGGGGPTAPADPYRIVATDNAFDKDTLVAPPNTEVTFTLVNDGRAKHNISFYTADPAAGGEEIHLGEIIDGNGATVTETFVTPDVGEYFFQCDVHPVEMRGVFLVQEGAPAPGETGGAGGGAAAEGDVVVTAENMAFDTNRIEATAGQPITIVLVNNDSQMHNISFYTDDSASELLVPEAEGEIIRQGETATMTFTPPSPGTYYFHCDLHPQMNGQFIVN